MSNFFYTRKVLTVGNQEYIYFSLKSIQEQFPKIADLPYSLKILLEQLLRNANESKDSKENILNLIEWGTHQSGEQNIPFLPARVLLQDFTGIPVLVDLASMRQAVEHDGGDPKKVNPLVPVDLVIDHSVQVDAYGSAEALSLNTQKEFARNRERYEFLKWASQSFDKVRIIPPATGIVHQVNLEYLAALVQRQRMNGEYYAFPDTVIGTDSHTTMINALGILGWGVGGIEAEAAMLGQPMSIIIPQVVGVKLIGAPRPGVMATDVVLHITAMLRKHGVVEKFVEFYGPGLRSLSVADRATIANMAPEYGATVGFFPADEQTLEYLRLTARSASHIDFVEQYLKTQGLFYSSTSPDPRFSELLTLDLGSVETCVAGPARPQDNIPLRSAKESFFHSFPSSLPDHARENPKTKPALRHGSVVIAAITSCTNTSNPYVLIAAGLLAKQAAEKGLAVPWYVKTSLAPGSKVVKQYLEKSGLLRCLEQLGFYLVGYGCTTCIGNSGPLPEEVTRRIQEEQLVVTSVLSGNRNFEGRVHPLTRANYLASPPLVVAYALAGRVDIDFHNEPLGINAQGEEVYLADIWPRSESIHAVIRECVHPQLFQDEYSQVTEGNLLWNEIHVSGTDMFTWNKDSTYIQNPPFFHSSAAAKVAVSDIKSARVLALFGDSVTTDHISPAGDIDADSPTGRYLQERGVARGDFNSYGARRGNHEVMMRGTFANVRLRNRLVHPQEGGWTVHWPAHKKLPIYEAAMKYQAAGTPLIILAGKDYGMGSSRDWAAKGARLLGVRAVIAESFERIHRSNLVGMGVLPLQFQAGENAQTLKLQGDEVFDILVGVSDMTTRKQLTVLAHGNDAVVKQFTVVCRLETPTELAYYRQGGILPFVLKKFVPPRVKQKIFTPGG